MTGKAKQCAWLWVTMSCSALAFAQAPANSPARAPAPPRARGPALAVAVQAAQIAVATCRERGYRTTALIVDSADVPVVLLSGDGVAERTQVIASTKAAAAIRFQMSSGEVVEKAKTDASLAAQIAADPKIGIARQGALLLKAGHDTIGALAVSGAPGGDKDEACAQAAIDKVKDQLQ